MTLDLPHGATAFRNGGPGALDPQTAARVLAAAADVAVVIDARGIVRDVAFGGAEMAKAALGEWLGRAWADTMGADSRGKASEMLGEDPARWRQVNHSLEAGGELPVRYFVTPTGHDGQRLAIGRDLRATATLQQRLLRAQQAMERDHMRSRQAETRYRALFDLSAEPVFIVDSARRRIVEANPAARRLAGGRGEALVGEPFADLIAPAERDSVMALLGAVAAAEQVSPAPVRLAGADAPHQMAATLFRQERAGFFLIRLVPPGIARAANGPDRLFAEMLDRMPEAFVVVDDNLAILAENAAFLDMAQLARGGDVRGQSLSRWLGRPGIDLALLVSEVREHGSVRNFATIMRGSRGGEEDVEIAAVSAPDADPPCLGFSIRGVSRRAVVERPPTPDMPRSVEQLTELVGRVPLKEIVRESTDLIERLCIEAALVYTSDNRASAAEILGLSRQSLYSKLHRHGLGDLAETH